MLLRRITEHVSAQNWFAVALDFVIVVIGVGVALLAQKWVSDYQQRQDMRRAESAVQADLASTYYQAKERVALVACRFQNYQPIANKLLEEEGEWTGISVADVALEESSLRQALPMILHSPARNWGSRIWEAELARGTFNQMDDAKRTELDRMFAYARTAQHIQDDIFELEGRLNTLAVSTSLSRSDRLRYYDILAEADKKSATLEQLSNQFIRSIEAIGLSVTAEVKREWLDAAIAEDDSSQNLYGDCRKPITLPLYQ